MFRPRPRGDRRLIDGRQKRAPNLFARRSRGHIPGHAIVAMTVAAFAFVVLGGLEEILEFGSITFLLVSLLMAFANLVKRRETGTHLMAAVGSMGILGLGAVGILVYQWQTNRQALAVTLGLYAVLLGAASVFSHRKTRGDR